MELINQELAQLTLKNIQLIEQSYDVLAKLNEHLCEKFNSIFDEWHKEIQDETGWYCTTDGKGEIKNYSIWFNWDTKYPKKDQNLINSWLWLSATIGLAKYNDDEEMTTGIHFGFNRNFFNLTAKEAKNFMTSQFEKYPKLKEQNFQFVTDGTEERSIFLPFKLNLDTLIQEYPDYDDKALEPFTNALDTVRKNLPVFQKIAADLQQYFKAE